LRSRSGEWPSPDGPLLTGSSAVPVLLDDSDLSGAVGRPRCCSWPATVFAGAVFEAGDVAAGVVEQVA